MARHESKHITSCTISWENTEDILSVVTKILQTEIQVRIFNSGDFISGRIWPMSEQQNQELYGKIQVDPISSLNFTLDKGSTYEGQLISNGTTNVVVNKDATWKLSGNSYITSLNSTGNINLNGFKLYVNGTEYKG